MVQTWLALGERRAHDGHGAGGTSPVLRLRLLGDFHACFGGSDVPALSWGRPKAATLVKLLALAPGHQLTRDQVLEDLWPDLSPTAAANNLYQVLHHARHALAAVSGTDAFLRLRNGVLALAPAGALDIDVDAFEREVGRAHAGREPAVYEAAIALYGGDLLPEDRYEDWAAPRREALREEYLRLLMSLTRLREDDEEWALAIGALQQAVAHEPLHEAAHAGLMRLYARAGQRHKVVRQWAQLRAALRTGLDAEPDRVTEALYHDILAGRFPPTSPRASASAPGSKPLTPAASASEPPAPRHNLPSPLTSFLGRNREITSITTHLASGTRLLTLTGAGGVGKTRLALEAARGMVAAFPGGVWLTELAPLTDPGQVPLALAAAAGVSARPAEPVEVTLARELGDAPILLILDNCEHLAAACASLAVALLHACPDLRVLATSREALRVPGEQVWRVPSMDVPPALADLAPDDLGRSEAATFLIDRIRWRLPAFMATRANAGALGAICRRLDGLPLALELAAARMSMLTPREIAARLDDALGLLTSGNRTAPARQQTLRATLDWSYQLLDEDERALLPLLAVFAGGWTLAAALAVASDSLQDSETATLTALTGLVDQSLVEVHDGDEEARYRLLEPIRQYAHALLSRADLPAGERERARTRHATFYLTMAERAAPELVGPEQVAWLDRFEREHDNLRVALRWALDSGLSEQALRAAEALGRFWMVRGHLTEGHAWLTELLAGHHPPTPDLAKALFGAGLVAFARGDRARARALFERMLTVARAVGAHEHAAGALTQLGHLAFKRGEHAAARPLYEEAFTIRRAHGPSQALAISLYCLGDLARARGDAAEARVYYHEGLALSRQLGDSYHLGHAFSRLGQLALAQGDAARGRELLEQSLAHWREVGFRVGVARELAQLGQLATDHDEPARARALFAESLRLFEPLDTPAELAACLAGCASLAVRVGAPAPALRLAGAADALRTDAETPPSLAPREPPPLPDSLVTAWQELGDDRAWAAWTAGQELGWGAAIGAARQLLGELSASPDPIGPGTPAALSPLVSPAVRPC